MFLRCIIVILGAKGVPYWRRSWLSSNIQYELGSMGGPDKVFAAILCNYVLHSRKFHVKLVFLIMNFLYLASLN